MARAYLESRYDELFDDEGHAIVAFVEYADSQYRYYIYTGRQASSVLDEDGRAIIMSRLDAYYTDSSLNDEHYFAKVFADSADTIMYDHEAEQDRKSSAVNGFVIGAVIVVGGIVGYIVYDRRKKAMEATKQVLETPLNPIGSDDPTRDWLESKYREDTGKHQG